MSGIKIMFWTYVVASVLQFTLLAVLQKPLETVITIRGQVFRLLCGVLYAWVLYMHIWGGRA